MWNQPRRASVCARNPSTAFDCLFPLVLNVSDGFDTYIADRIGTFQLTAAGISEVGRRIRALDVPTLVVQEGGYCVPNLG